MTTKVDLGVKKIIPYRRRPLFLETLEGTLYNNGNTMIPGSVRKVYPRVDARGRVRTGLDENAIKILSIQDKETREKEQERIKALRLLYEGMLNESLVPESPYWEIVKGQFDNESNSGGAYLEDKENIFDMNNPEHAITFYWIMETGLVAPSLTDIESGRVDLGVSFYVHDAEIEDKVKFERKKRINSAKVKLDALTTVDLRKVAKLIGLGVSKLASDETVYAALDEYLGLPKKDLDSDPIDNFNRILAYSKDLLDVKTLVLDLLHYNIVREYGTVIKEGEHVWATNVDEFEALLLDPINHEVLRSFREKLQNKIKVS